MLTNIEGAYYIKIKLYCVSFRMLWDGNAGIVYTA